MEIHDSAQADHVSMVLFDELPYNVESERGDWFLRVSKDDTTPKKKKCEIQCPTYRKSPPPTHLPWYSQNQCHHQNHDDRSLGDSFGNVNSQAVVKEM